HYTLQPGSAMAFTTQDAQDTWFHDSSSFRNLNICTSYAALKRFLASEFDTPITRDITFTPEPVEVGHEFRYLLDYIRWFSARVDDRIEHMLANSPHLARHMHDLLMSLLVSAVKNNYQELYYSPDDRCIAPVYVRRA